MKLGAMQDWPLRVMRLVDHAEREHGDGEIVSAWGDGSVTRTNWAEVARDARRMAQEGGAPSLQQQEVMAEERVRADVMGDPSVRALLDAFPDATYVSHQRKEG